MTSTNQVTLAGSGQAPAFDAAVLEQCAGVVTPGRQPTRPQGPTLSQVDGWKRIEHLASVVASIVVAPPPGEHWYRSSSAQDYT